MVDPKSNPIRSFLRISIILFIIIAIFWVGPAPKIVRADAIIRVSPSGNDNNACGGQNAPCLTIQYATGKAVSGDSILVARGIYTYSANYDTCNSLVTPAVVCFVDKSLSILGGYNPIDWSGPDAQKNPTIIDGGNTYRGVAVVAYNSTASIHMEDFTIQKGIAKGNSTNDPIYNSAFGGGMWAFQSSVNLKDMTFKNNQAVGGNIPYTSGGVGSGGGLAIISTKQGASSLQNIVFEGNKATGGSGTVRGGVAIGGAIATNTATVTGTNLTFTNNVSQAGNSSGNGFDGGMWADALGGAAAFSEGSNIDLSNVTATGNKAIGGDAGTSGVAGGGFGGAFHAEKGISFKLQYARIMDNEVIGGTGMTGGVAMGGGLMTDATDSIIDNTWVLANTAKSGGSSTAYQAGTAGGGGAYFAYWSNSGSHSTTITNSVFADNKVEAGTPGEIVGDGGGGAVFLGVQAVVTHATFAENTIGQGLFVGQAITVQGNGDGTGNVLGNLTMRYSIISDHTGVPNASAVTVFKNNFATFSSVLFANNSHVTNADGLPLASGNITLSNPIYEASAGYASPGSPNYDYHLSSSSSAIDKAVGSTTLIDIDGQARPQGAAPDLGADEYSLPDLIVSPDPVNVMTKDNTPILFTWQINADSCQGVNWNATVDSSWLYFGISGTSQVASGVCGDKLVVRIEPGLIKDGIFNANIQVASPDANPVTISIELIKVNTIYANYFPIAIK